MKKRVLIAIFAVSLALSLCGCDPGVPEAPKAPETETTEETGTTEETETTETTEQGTPGNTEEPISTEATEEPENTESGAPEWNNPVPKSKYNREKIEDYVKTVKQETIEIKASENWETVFTYPGFTFRDGDAELVEMKAKDFLDPAVEENKDAKYNNCDPEWGGAGYEAWLFQDCIYVLLTLDDTYGGSSYRLYVLDFNTHKLLTRAEQLARWGLTEEHFESVLTYRLEERFDSMNLSGLEEEEKKSWEERQKETFTAENLAQAMFIIRPDGTNCALAKVASIAGADYHWEYIDLNIFLTPEEAALAYESYRFDNVTMSISQDNNGNYGICFVIDESQIAWSGTLHHQEFNENADQYLYFYGDGLLPYGIDTTGETVIVKYTQEKAYYRAIVYFDGESKWDFTGAFHVE